MTVTNSFLSVEENNILIYFCRLCFFNFPINMRKMSTVFSVEWKNIRTLSLSLSLLNNAEPT